MVSTLDLKVYTFTVWNEFCLLQGSTFKLDGDSECRQGLWSDCFSNGTGKRSYIRLVLSRVKPDSFTSWCRIVDAFPYVYTLLLSFKF